MSEPRAEGGGLYARIRVRPTSNCVLRQLSEDHHVRQYMPGTPNESRPQVVVEPTAEAPRGALDADSIEEIIWMGDRAVCFLGHTTQETVNDEETIPSAGTERPSTGCEMVLYGFGALPVAPVDVRLADGWLELHLVTTAYPRLRDTVSDLRAAAFDVDIRQVVRSEQALGPIVEEGATLSVVDLSMLTDRQREVARVAVEMGYFDESGAAAEEAAAALNISKSTLSEHLRIVIRKILSQILP